VAAASFEAAQVAAEHLRRPRAWSSDLRRHEARTVGEGVTLDCKTKRKREETLTDSWLVFLYYDSFCINDLTLKCRCDLRLRQCSPRFFSPVQTMDPVQPVRGSDLEQAHLGRQFAGAKTEAERIFFNSRVQGVSSEAATWGAPLPPFFSKAWFAWHARKMEAEAPAMLAHAGVFLAVGTIFSWKLRETAILAGATYAAKASSRRRKNEGQ
jgi:hypothetical protein